MAAGLFLRLWQLDLTPFGNDEGLLAIYASQVGNLRGFPPFGVPTSLGFRNPPLLVYLVAPFFGIARDPRLAMVVFALAGTAAVGLAALTGKRLWGNRAGLAAGILLAFSPLAIEHSRRLWGHDTIIFWSALCFYAAVRGAQEAGKKKDWIWLMVSMGAAAAAQACHLSGIVLWIAPVGALALFRPRRGAAALCGGMMVLLLIYLPWLLHDAIANRFEELTLMAHIAMGRLSDTNPACPFPPALSWIGILSDSFQHNQLQHVYERFLRSGAGFGILARTGQSLGVFLLLGGSALLMIESLTRLRASSPRGRWACLVFLCVCAPLGLFSILPVARVAAYQLPALVPAVLSAAFFLSRTNPGSPSARRMFRCLRGAILIVFAAAGIFYTTQARRAQARLSYADFSAATLRNKTDAVKYMSAMAGDAPYAVMQETRPRRVGIDFSLLYLHYAVTGDPANPVARDAPLIFLVHENHIFLPAEIEQWLANKPMRTFGPLAVFRLEDENARAWQEIVEKPHGE